MTNSDPTEIRATDEKEKESIEVAPSRVLDGLEGVIPTRRLVALVVVVVVVVVVPLLATIHLVQSAEVVFGLHRTSQSEIQSASLDLVRVPGVIVPKARIAK